MLSWREFAATNALYPDCHCQRAQHRSADEARQKLARCADRIAGEWADLRDIEHIKFAADWKKFGRPAGPIRNEQMLREGKPDLVIALPGSRGTAHMVRMRARPA